MEPIAHQSDQFLIGGDLPVYRLGFGAMRITGKGIWGPPASHDEALAVLRRSLELGINFIDTADSYGPNVSETLLAEALYPYPQGLVIATKGGLTRSGPDQWAPNGHPDYLRTALEGSLKRLRLEQIDLYQLHRIDPEVPADEQLGVLARMREEGKIRHVGLSEVDAAQLKAAQAIVPIVTIQNRYNLIDREWEPLVDLCDEQQIGFIPWFPLATGDLARPGSVLSAIAARLSATPSQVALAWLLHRAPTMLPIPGTSSVQHLEDNTQAAALKLSADDMAVLGRLGDNGSARQ